MSHFLPTKIPGYLLRLSLEYARTNQMLHELIVVSRLFVVEETAFDNWNGGIHGHDVWLYLPLDALAEISINNQADVTKTILDDLRKLAGGIENEFINAVHLEMNDENDPNFQCAILSSAQPNLVPESLAIWKPGLVRLFISHRDSHKIEANELADALGPFGISSFVAHDTIQPMSEWRQEIMKALETMEIMLIFLTDDFDQSTWTNQEIGFALGAKKPIVSLKLGQKDPSGFISHQQALRGNISAPFDAAQKIYPILAKALRRQERLQTALVTAFTGATDWADAKIRFDRMDGSIQKLSDNEVSIIIDGFYRNDQLHKAGYLTHRGHWRMHTFLERTTGKEFLINDRRITEKSNLPEIPF